MRRTEDGTGPARTPGGRGNIRRRARGRGVADEVGPPAGGRGSRSRSRCVAAWRRVSGVAAGWGPAGIASVWVVVGCWVVARLLLLLVLVGFIISTKTDGVLRNLDTAWN